MASLEKAFYLRIKHREMNLIATHDLLQQMMNVTRFKIEQNRTDEAEQFFLDAERIFQHKMPQSNDYLENVRQYLYTLYMQQGRYSLADSYKTK